MSMYYGPFWGPAVLMDSVDAARCAEAYLRRNGELKDGEDFDDSDLYGIIYDAELADDYDDGNCCSFDVAATDCFNGCGRAVRYLNPCDGDSIYVQWARTGLNPFKADYKDLDELVAEFQNYEGGLSYGQSEQFIKDHLAYIALVSFG